MTNGKKTKVRNMQKTEGKKMSNPTTGTYEPDEALLFRLRLQKKNDVGYVFTESKSLR